MMGSRVEEELVTAISINERDGPRTLSHLPDRPPVDIEFTDVSYTVPQGRKGKSKVLIWQYSKMQAGRQSEVINCKLTTE
jgi:hypothetical protein